MDIKPPPATWDCHPPPETDSRHSKGDRRPDMMLRYKPPANHPVSGLPLLAGIPNR